LLIVSGALFGAQVAADWWRNNVFVKTYRERRTWMAVFRAYYRVYAAHLVLYHAMQAQAFVGWNYRMISSCLITHAFCAALERFCNWYMTRHPPEPLQTALSKAFDKKGAYKITRRAKQEERDAALNAMHAGFGEAKTIGNTQSRMQPVRVVEVEGSPYLGVLGFVEWILLAFFVLGW
jgi:1,3-beta-glucan synthase